jgi:AsmA-like C-terminal region
LFYLINQKNSKLSLVWIIRSNKINLNDFVSYLKKKETITIPKKKKPLLAETLTQISNLIETANIHVDLQAKQFVYKKFYADNLVANLDLNDDVINLKNLKLQQGSGTIGIQGALRNEATSNPFSFTAQMHNINVSKIFTGFNNFGMKTLTDKNIAGVLAADVKLNGGITTKAQIIPEETKGTVKFSLKDGQLIDFDAVKKISQTIFKNRNFSDIQFAELHDVFDINGENVTINRMEIHSSVLTMFVEGMYNTRTGPDLSIQVPLSNLKASKDTVLTNKGINSKTGVSARLRAQSGEDGKIKISWDPFNKSGKAMKKSKNKGKAKG